MLIIFAAPPLSLAVVSCSSLILERIAGVSTTTEAKRTERIIADDDCRAEGKGGRRSIYDLSMTDPTIRMRKGVSSQLQPPSPTRVITATLGDRIALETARCETATTTMTVTAYYAANLTYLLYI